MLSGETTLPTSATPAFDALVQTLRSGSGSDPEHVRGLALALGGCAPAVLRTYRDELRTVASAVEPEAVRTARDGATPQAVAGLRAIERLRAGSRRRRPPHTRASLSSHASPTRDDAIGRFACLLTTALSAPDDVRPKLIDTLRSIDEEALAAVAERASTSPIAEARVVAVEAMCASSRPAAEVLLGSLTDHEERVRVAAVKGLCTTLGVEVFDAIAERVSDPSPRVRRVAIWALRNLDDVRAATYLLSAVDDPADDVTGAAKEALRSMTSPASTDAVIDALADSALQGPASAVLVERGRSAVEPLIAALAGAAADHRRRIGDVLRALKASRFVNELAESPDAAVRREAVEAVGSMAVHGSAEPLLTFLDDPDTQVRLRAVELIGAVGDRRVVDPLALAAACEPNPAVRRAIDAASSRIRALHQADELRPTGGDT